jgi:4-hydroxythreonine-4-phosphate dehydrogenase
MAACNNVLVTMGDPAGVSGEIVARAWAALAAGRDPLARRIRALLTRRRASLHVVGDPGVLGRALAGVRPRVPMQLVDELAPGPPGVLRLFPRTRIDLRRFRFGVPAYGREQLDYLDFAIAQARARTVAAIVTGPVTKEAVAAVAPGFLGHTGYLADKLGVRDERMAFLTPDYLLALETTHVPLGRVASQLSVAGIATSLGMLAAAGRSAFPAAGRGQRPARPPVAVLGLNPHAGEHGLMGDEEERIILPAMRLARRRGIPCDGPFPADSFFIERVRRFRLILAMYHDQGLIAVKPAYPRASVNVTLGLPVVRTSVDHGSGYDIAGKGQASAESLLHAMAAALHLLG